MAIKYTVMPLNQIVKMPNDAKWRNVLTTSSFLKQVSNVNAEALESVLTNIGFTRITDKNYKFQIQDDSSNGGLETNKQTLIKPGNLKTITEAVKHLNSKLAELKKQNSSTQVTQSTPSKTPMSVNQAQSVSPNQSIKNSNFSPSPTMPF